MKIGSLLLGAVIGATLFVGAWDLATNTFEHTGIQSVARRVAQRAYSEI